MRYARVSLQAHAFIAFGIALASRAIFYPVSQNTTRATSGLMQACLLRANNPTSGIRVSASESCQITDIHGPGALHAIEAPTQVGLGDAHKDLGQRSGSV